jgi:hypothetical protein
MKRLPIETLSGSLLCALALLTHSTPALADNGKPVVQAWTTHGHDAQHTGVSSVKAQPMRKIHWTAPVDLDPIQSFGELLNHYGSPLITAANTVIVPVKTGRSDGFRIDARNGKDGTLKWSLNTDYSVPQALFLPTFGPVLVNNRVVVPAAGGTVLIRDQANSANGTVTRVAFYGLEAFNADPATFSSNVKINTPITADAKGNLYFGFIVSGPTPVPLQSGLARIGADGRNSWVAASVASSDPQILQVNMNSTPAMSIDGSLLYFAVNSTDGIHGGEGGDDGFGYLIAADANTLQTVHLVRLVDPASGLDSDISRLSSASPTIGPDGDVYFGVLEREFPAHEGRGWLLHFNAKLSVQKLPGAFGWDDTTSIVAASLVNAYHGKSTYLIMSKYNDYAEDGGTGLNKVAILDPNAAQPDDTFSVREMKEVITALGVTPDPTFTAFLPNAVREWCINTAAVDPASKSVFVNSEDGNLYRWDLNSNTLADVINLTGGLGEAYTPTAIGVDGTIYAINEGILFAIGDDH